MFRPLPLFLFFLAMVGLLPSWAAGRTLSGKVVKIFDGDTFLVRIQGREDFVRLREIDAPEISTRKRPGQEPWGRKAREFALSRAGNRAVRLEVEERDERDRYDRLLAYVFTGDSFINREMILSGNAFFYPVQILGRYAPQLEAAEAAARQRGSGVWDRGTGLKESPKEFRARTQRAEGLFSTALRNSAAQSRRFSSEQVPGPPDKIVGNKRSRVYHPAGSKEGARVSLRNRVLFDSAEEAEKAGYRQARSNAERGMRIAE